MKEHADKVNVHLCHHYLIKKGRSEAVMRHVDKVGGSKEFAALVQTTRLLCYNSIAFM